MTALFKKFVFVCLVILLTTPLTKEVFAQSLSEGNEISTSTPTVTSEIISSEDLSIQNNLWYRSEQISGNIDVGDFVVGPGRTEVEIKPGETIIKEITVTNRISEDRIFKLEIEDITGSSDGSSAASLTGRERGPYSIRDYISFPEDTFVLKLGERARIPITITMPANAEPGGYYGSVLVSTIRDKGSVEPTAPRSPIIARVGSLFFITVPGETLTEGKTVEVSLIGDKLWYERGPIQLGILYENAGSVHLNPYGELTVTNMFGEEVGFIELEPWFVLPTSLRVREITWDREFLLGRYTVIAKINRGYDDIVDEVTVSFWVLPWKIVSGTFLVLFIIIFSMRAFFRTFEFKRKGE